MKFLFLGNDAHLRLVNWDLVRNSSLVVVGINRSYFLYKDHDFLFLQDPKTAIELIDKGLSCSDIKDLNIYTTRYFKGRLAKEYDKRRFTKQEYDALLALLAEDCVKIYKASNKIHHFSPFSLINAMCACYDFYSEEIEEAGSCTFYLHGCGLKHRPDNNHFWVSRDGDDLRYETNSPGGSSPRQLARQLLTLKRLKPIFSVHDIRVVSCNEDSPLNKLYPHENLGSVLRKNQKVGG